MAKTGDRSPYFVGPLVDIPLLGGLSVAAALGFEILERTGTAVPASRAALALAWVINWPHFSATIYRLYRTRQTRSQYPLTTWGIPVLVLAGAIAACAWPREVAPALVKLFMLWSPFHFSGQTYGLSLLYARRSGWDPGRLDRAALAGFIYSSYAHLVVSQELSSLFPRSGDVRVPVLPLPPELVFVTDGVMHLQGVLLLMMFARACLLERRLLPPVILLPPLAQYIWLMAGLRLPEFSLFVPLFHSLQYLLVAWALQVKERRDAVGAAAGPRFLLRETWTWGLANVVGGALLFFILPRLAAYSGVPLGLAEPVLNAAIQIHHFFVDGVIWKLRQPSVGLPLLARWADLKGGAA